MKDSPIDFCVGGLTLRIPQRLSKRAKTWNVVIGMFDLTIPNTACIIWKESIPHHEINFFFFVKVDRFDAIRDSWRIEVIKCPPQVMQLSGTLLMEAQLSAIMLRNHCQFLNGNVWLICTPNRSSQMFAINCTVSSKLFWPTLFFTGESQSTSCVKLSKSIIPVFYIYCSRVSQNLQHNTFSLDKYELLSSYKLSLTIN